MTEESLKPKIGLEIHTQLDTDSKLFCSCPVVEDNAKPNSAVCPVCLGLPGSLPTLNESVIEKAIFAGKAIDAEISEEFSFDRKHYFYPDLPKGFQITQYQKPICKGGYIELEDRIEFRRAHIEEDPGSLSYDGDITSSSKTKADYNRSGVPLIEFVTEPQIESASQAREFVETLIKRLDFVGVIDQKKSGSVRVDANISVSETGSEESTKIEVKNIGSPSEVQDAIKYEITRQKDKIRRGKEIQQTTRHWDESKGVTTTLRTKETEADYRYIREYDLPTYKIQKFE